MEVYAKNKEVYCKYCGSRINDNIILQGFSVVCPHCKRPL